MISNPKALGVVMTALFAMGALMAATAGASGETFTTVHGNSPVNVSATSTKDTFTYEGTTVACTNISFAGTATSGSTAVTVTPVYKTCTGALGLPLTVECGAGTYEFTAGTAPILHIKQGCTMTIYLNAAHTSVCAIIHIPAQTPTTPKLAYTNVGTGTTSEVNISGTVEGIHATYTRISGLCPALAAETKQVVYHIQSGGINFTALFGGAHEGIHHK